jgi:membrane fusion protein, multidrug efflux system
MALTMGSITRRWRLLTGLLLVLLALGAFLWFARQKATPTPTGGRFGLGAPMAVATSTASTGDIPVTLAALGTVAPLATATVKTQVSGQLQQIAFKEGQMVRKGDFLAQIDPRPFQNTLAQAEATLSRDQAQLQNARLDLQRYGDLLAEDSIAKQQLDTQKALVQQLEGTVAADTAQVNAAKLNLQYAHISAPISGRAGLRQVDVGNYVTAGDANGIVVITQLQPITVVFPIPEDNVPALMQRLRAGATLPVTALNRDNTAQLATGTLITVDNQMDTTTGTVKLRAQFDNRDEQLFPNQFVNIRLLVDTLHNQVLVPVAAVQHGTVNNAPGTFVYVANSDSTVSVRPVTLGTTTAERVAIASGLAAGDVVVTEGADRLRDGAKVMLHGVAPPASARGPGAGSWNGRRRGNGMGNPNGRRRGTGQPPGAGQQGGGSPGGP